MIGSKTFTLFAAALAALSSTALAAPTRTEKVARDYGYSGVAPAGATHSVVVGRGGLRFDPENVVAEIGDIVEFHFTARNHSVAQSNFANPCNPIGPDAFFSGFDFVTQYGQNDNVFQITIQDKSPIWYYCAQTNMNHCQNGMAGVINQNFDSNEFTLAKYKENAWNLGRAGYVSTAPAYVGGSLNARVVPNPNPLSGF
ncbi:hypothetical protein H072_4982 [Dactylellina haptotyla CBS 200.50]|uniref:Plastocyanin-like domain-containing protein n=1 Tax=Dactylellina haptotyla (strain CBS 200.50) TaxID=1284197 RepID=S8ADM3_DACHA|nr:hypothetical protein H072_4982 [Dactylellina haptotyla CBS 200.50]